MAHSLLAENWVVAVHELRDSIRSRRAVVLLVLYVIGAIAATLLFIKLLHALENQIEKASGVAVTQQAGGTTSALWKNSQFKEVLIHLVGNKRVALQLLDIPPLAVFYGWLSFTFAPMLVMLISAGRISEEIWSGSVRFVMFRTSRLSWCVGKYTGQALQLLVALLLSGLAAWIVGWCRLSFYDPVATGLAVGLFALKAWIYSIAFLGLAMAVSQLVASPNVAIALGFIAMVVCGTLSILAGAIKAEPWSMILQTVDMIVPGGHQLDLWLPDAMHALPAAVWLLCLGACYMLAGYASFSRRNL